MIELLKTLQSQRKWYDCSECIKDIVKSSDHSKYTVEMLTVFKNILPSMHTETAVDTAIALSSIVAPKDALSILQNTLGMCMKKDTTKYFQPIAKIGMNICLTNISLGNFENIEKMIIQWKNSVLTNCNFILLHFLGFKFYEGIGNLENSHEYFIKYVSLSGDVHNIEKLVRLSLLSKNFYDFSYISNLEEFSSLSQKNIELKLLFEDFQRGHFEKINNQRIEAVLECRNPEAVREKVYLVNIINICFDAADKMVNFDVFTARMNIDSNYLLYLLMKALGAKLVTGWIDSEKNTLFFDRVMPRSLSKDEISKMKEKFCEWSNRVQRSIELMESY
jgi:hypothetical protein